MSTLNAGDSRLAPPSWYSTIRLPSLPTLAGIYGNDPQVIKTQHTRYRKLIDELSNQTSTPRQSIRLARAPGRQILLGDHLAPNGGVVLAASITQDIAASFCSSPTSQVKIVSGSRITEFNVNSPHITPSDKNFMKSVKGVVQAVKRLHPDIEVGGYNVLMHSILSETVGLGSSAAYALLNAQVINSLFCGGRLSQSEMAKIALHAEKWLMPSRIRLDDHYASALDGGIKVIDFLDSDNPRYSSLPFTATCDLSFNLIDSGGEIPHYEEHCSQISNDMRAVATFIKLVKDKKLKLDEARDIVFPILTNTHSSTAETNSLSEIPKATFQEMRHVVAGALGARCATRAMHFFDESDRVKRLTRLLTRREFIPSALRFIEESGRSAEQLLDALHAPGDQRRELGYIFRASRNILSSYRQPEAVKINGGAFSGTLLAVVRSEFGERFRDKLVNEFMDPIVEARIASEEVRGHPGQIVETSICPFGVTELTSIKDELDH